MSKLIWSGSPSLLMTIPSVLTGILFFFLVIPLYKAIEKVLFVWLVKYEVYEDRIIIKFGILSKNVENIEMFRVKDICVDIPWWYRIFGLGHIKLITSDKSYSKAFLEAIPNTEWLADRIREVTNTARASHGVQELDVNHSYL